MTTEFTIMLFSIFKPTIHCGKALQAIFFVTGE